MNPAQAYTIMFFTGGFLYCALEILMRGYSHISMLLAGGICFVLVGAVPVSYTHLTLPTTSRV